MSVLKTASCIRETGQQLEEAEKLIWRNVGKARGGDVAEASPDVARIASGVDMVRWQSGARMPIHRVTPIPGSRLRSADQSGCRAREGCCDLSESQSRYRPVDVMHIPEMPNQTS
jgi:hypothetical protein